VCCLYFLSNPIDVSGVSSRHRQPKTTMARSVIGSRRKHIRVLAVLVPSFLGAALLLFANSFSAYATAASLISQGSIITPLEISTALSSETGVANAATAKALGLGMVIVVGIVMTLYTLMRRRVSKWEQ
jgi:putative spermidine/putrescine transport system permease protein